MSRPVSRVSARVARLVVSALVVGLPLGGCGRQDDSDLWARSFPSPAPAASDVTGYWEGRVYAGDIRLRIDKGSIIAALKCDVHGETVTSQGSAPVAVATQPSARMILQADLAGDRKGCGFLFAKGSEFAYAVNGRGVLRMDFAGTGASDFTRLADLPARD